MGLGFILFFWFCLCEGSPEVYWGLHRAVVSSKGPTCITEILVTQDDIKDHLITVLWTALPPRPECGEHMSRSQKNQNKYSAFLPNIIEFGGFYLWYSALLGETHGPGFFNSSSRKKERQRKKKILILLIKKMPLLGFVWLFHKSNILWLKQILFIYFQTKRLPSSNGKKILQWKNLLLDFGNLFLLRIITTIKEFVAAFLSLSIT